MSQENLLPMSNKERIRKPDWLKIKLPTGDNFSELNKNISENKLHTICESGRCPNKEECWGAGTATIMILGNTCTRSCQFCNVETGKPEAVDIFEPARVALAIKKMDAKHLVITSVDRDDLKDGGATIWAATVRAIRKQVPHITLETLIPDFQGKEHLLDYIVDVTPEVVSHNIETVERMSKLVRVQAQYERSLAVLNYLKKQGIRRTKSGIMLGLGETQDEVIQSLRDLRENQVDIVTLGQYLQPTKNHLPVYEYISPEMFKNYEKIAKDMGFMYVESGPMVRSSYHAEKHIV